MLYKRERLLDKTQTFQQSRQIYLSFLPIDSAAACVEIDEEFAKVIAGCKMFTPQAPTPQAPSIKHFQRLVDPRYLPIRTYEDLPWEVQKDSDYEGALQFTAFVSNFSMIMVALNKVAMNHSSPSSNLCTAVTNMERLHWMQICVADEIIFGRKFEPKIDLEASTMKWQSVGGPGSV